MASILELTTPPAVAAISTADAKTHLRITHSDEDTLIDRYVLAATEWVERQINRSLINTTWTERFSSLPASELEPLRLSRAPLSSVTTFKYYDTDDTLQTWSTDDYDVYTPRNTPGRVTVTPGYTWPIYRTDRAYPIEVAYVAGYGAAASSIPDDLLELVYLVLDDMYRFRGASVCMQFSEPVAVALSRMLRAHGTGVYP